VGVVAGDRYTPRVDVRVKDCAVLETGGTSSKGEGGGGVGPVGVGG